MKRTMKFILAVEYELPFDAIADDVEKAHMEVFEESPGDFLNYILSKETTDAEYEFQEMVGEEVMGDGSGEFDCKLYFFHNADAHNNLCRKFGALCSNILCPHLK